MATIPNIKICGLVRAEDAELCVKLGATHLGCVLTPTSTNAVTPAQAKLIFQTGGKKITGVLVFREPETQTVLAACKEAGTKHVQIEEFSESVAEELEEAGLTVYRRLEVTVGTNMLPPILPAPTPKSPVMLQCAQKGTGLTFPWELLGNDAPANAFIGGGVSPENICALLTHAPYGVNLSSSLEMRPGVLDPDRVELFFEVLSKGY